jgi:hypothetical protein
VIAPAFSRTGLDLALSLSLTHTHTLSHSLSLSLPLSHTHPARTREHACKRESGIQGHLKCGERERGRGRERPEAGDSSRVLADGSRSCSRERERGRENSGGCRLQQSGGHRS